MRNIQIWLEEIFCSQTSRAASRTTLDTCLRDGGQEDSSNKETGAVGSTAAVCGSHSRELGRGCLVSLWYHPKTVFIWAAAF